MKKDYTVYGLVCPLSSQVFYIGCTSSPNKRLGQHMADPASSAWRHCQTLRDEGLKPSMVVFAVLTDRYVARMVEARLIKTLSQEIVNKDSGFASGFWYDLRYDLYD